MLKRIRDLFRLSWVDKPAVQISDCDSCAGWGQTYLDGTPAAIGQINPNIRPCGNCGGRGIVYGERIV